MGVPLYTVKTNEYRSILQQQLCNGNMFVEKIQLEDHNVLCMFSGISNFEYIFWQQHSCGDISLQILNEKSKNIENISGYITRVGKIFCQSILEKKSLVEYFNDLII